jgi:hypothetical protein
LPSVEYIPSSPRNNLPRSGYVRSSYFTRLMFSQKHSITLKLMGTNSEFFWKPSHSLGTLLKNVQRMRLRHTTEVYGSNKSISADDRKDRGKPVRVIGAHFDGVPRSPGADDNASSVAELVQYLMKTNRFYFTEAHILDMIGFMNQSPYSHDCPLGGMLRSLFRSGRFCWRVR